MFANSNVGDRQMYRECCLLNSSNNSILRDRMSIAESIMKIVSELELAERQHSTLQAANAVDTANP